MQLDQNQVEETKNIHTSYMNYSSQFDLNSFEEKFQSAIQQRKADENPFTLSTNKDLNILIIKVNHITVTVNEAKRLKDLITVSLKKENKNFIINLIDSHVIDSTFLGAVILSLKKINNIGGKLVVVADPMKLKILHSFTELYRVLNIKSDFDSALKEFI